MIATPQRTILHGDMDAFFAAVEQLDDPGLRGRPVIVGAAPDKRGVVCTCSYEARVFGVHSAMPSRTAYKLCPHGIFVAPRSDRYAEVSAKIFEVFQQFSPFVEKLSIDEAFLDVTSSQHLFGGGVETAVALRAAVQRQTGLTVSVGVAPNKFLAKLASDMDKPDGLTVTPLEQEAIEAFLAPLPVRRIWGVGKVAGDKLAALGLETVAQLQRLREIDLQDILGLRAGGSIYRLCRGLDKRDVVMGEPEKSISNERTFGDDVRDWNEVEKSLLTLTEKVGGRLRKAGFIAKTATIRVRWSNFETLTRQRKLDPPTASDRSLITSALELLDGVRTTRPVRLIGFGVSNLVPADEPIEYQLDLFEDAESGTVVRERDQHIDSAVDKIRQQFGGKAIGRGLKRKDEH